MNKKAESEFSSRSSWFDSCFRPRVYDIFLPRQTKYN